MKGMKFYGDRTRKEMRQDIKEHRKSLSGDKEAIKADRKYQRGRKKELRGEELIRRGKTKRGEKKIDRGSSIIEGATEPGMLTQKTRKFKNKRKHKKNLEERSSFKLDPKKKSKATAGSIVGDIDNKLGDAFASGDMSAARKAYNEVKSDIKSVLAGGGKEAESLRDLINVDKYKSFNSVKKAYKSDK